MKQRLLSFCIGISLLAGTAEAQLQRIVLQGAGAPQVFTDINAALIAAQPNDRLYFSGGTFHGADGITVDKPLHFIGAGIHPDSSNVTGSTTWTTTSPNNIIITTSASGSTFTGIIMNSGSLIQYGTSSVDDDPTDLVFQRCEMMDSFYLGIAEPSSSSSSFDECIFRKYLVGLGGKAVVTRCIFESPSGGITLFRPSGLFVKNSVFLAARLQNSDNAIVQNCVFTFDDAPLYQVKGVQISNCLITSTDMFSNSGFTNQESNNIYGQAADAIFVNETNGVYNFDDDLHLAPTSPGVGAGNDGRDIGIYGSGSPYKEGASPYNPHYQAADIGGATNSSGELPVNIRMAAQPQ